MSVTNIECQLAKGQIGRYLAGDALSPEALRQLEAHIGDCPSCKAALFERKAVLQLMLGQDAPAKAVIETELPDPVVELPKAAKQQAKLPNPMAQALRAHAEAEKQKGKPKPAAVEQKKTISKPLLFSSGLAVVLMAMSYLSKTEMSPFGPKALSIFGSANKPASRVTPTASEPTSPTGVAPRAASYMPKPIPSTPVANEPQPAPVNTSAPTSAPTNSAPTNSTTVPTPQPAQPSKPVATAKPASTPTPAAPKPAAKPAKAPVTVKVQPTVVKKHPVVKAHRAAHRKVARKHHLRRGTGSVKVYR